jgi:hypothetical protein
MAVGLASGLAAIALTALLPDAVPYINLGAQLAGIAWVYFRFGAADGRPSAVAMQVLSAGASLTVGLLGAITSRRCWGSASSRMAAGMGGITTTAARRSAHVVTTLLRRRRRRHRPASARRLGALAP